MTYIVGMAEYDEDDFFQGDEYDGMNDSFTPYDLDNLQKFHNKKPASRPRAASPSRSGQNKRCGLLAV